MEKYTTKIQKIVDEYQNKVGSYNLLEAGCGSISQLKFNSNAFVSGIDISQKQLDRNAIIDEKILGDIQSYQLESNTFDIIICWHVLEHLRFPKQAIQNFFKAAKKNAIIILASPNPFSIKGLVTKFSPHWFHVFVYRYIYGRKDAGKDDNAPFKTFLKFSLSLEAISNFAIENNLKVELIVTLDALNGWVGELFKKKSKIAFYFLKFLRATVKVISFGKITDSDYVIVLRK